MLKKLLGVVVDALRYARYEKFWEEALAFSCVPDFWARIKRIDSLHEDLKAAAFPEDYQDVEDVIRVNKVRLTLDFFERLIYEDKIRHDPHDETNTSAFDLRFREFSEMLKGDYL